MKGRKDLSSLKKQVFKVISLVLCILLVSQSAGICANGSNYVGFNHQSKESFIEETYTSAAAVYSGRHSRTIGRAGTFSFDDYTLLTEHEFNLISIASNVYPVDITMNFNSKEYRFLKAVDGIEGNSYGKGWLPNYGILLCEVEFTDERQLYSFDGNGVCTMYHLSSNIT